MKKGFGRLLFSFESKQMRTRCLKQIPPDVMEGVLQYFGASESQRTINEFNRLGKEWCRLVG